MQRARQYWQRMEEVGLEPNLVSYNTVINACAILGEASKAVTWLACMTEKGITPDLVTYSTLCKAFAREGKADVVEDIMRWLDASGYELNEYFFASLISACGE